MKAVEYKQQFISLLRTAFPESLPEGAETMTLSVNGTQFVFKFDPQDYASRNAKKPKIYKVKAFDDRLTEKDIDLLKIYRISTQDVEEPKRQ